MGHNNFILNNFADNWARWDTQNFHDYYSPVNALFCRHDGRDGISNHQPHDCLLNRSFRHRSKKTSKCHVTGLCVRNSQVTDEFPAQMASNAQNFSIWWCHHGLARWHTLILLLPSQAPNFTVIQWGPFVNWTHRTKLQWNLNHNRMIFIKENASENVVYKMSAFLFRPHAVDCRNRQ